MWTKVNILYQTNPWLLHKRLTANISLEIYGLCILWVLVKTPTMYIERCSCVFNSAISCLHINKASYKDFIHNICYDNLCIQLCVSQDCPLVDLEEVWMHFFMVTRFAHVCKSQNQEITSTVLRKRNLSAVSLCSVPAVKWLNPGFPRTSSAVQCVWSSWRIQWPFHVDTVTVWAALQTTGITRIRREFTAALSADKPSVQDLL